MLQSKLDGNWQCVAAYNLVRLREPGVPRNRHRDGIDRAEAQVRERNATIKIAVFDTGCIRVAGDARFDRDP